MARKRINNGGNGKRRPKLILGPVGKFPDGKYGHDDKGEIQFAIGIDEQRRRIVIDFGILIKWMAPTPEQALNMAKGIKERAEMLIAQQPLKPPEKKGDEPNGGE